jgi:hypothetical protein
LYIREFDHALNVLNRIPDPYDTLHHWIAYLKGEKMKTYFEEFFIEKLSSLVQKHSRNFLKFIRGKFRGKELEIVEKLDSNRAL